MHKNELLRNIDNAVKKHAAKQLKKQRTPRRKNQSPEKDTEKEVMTWLRNSGFDCNVIESKAVFSQAAGRYLSGQTDPGVSDVLGNDKNGRACYIELKARGKKSTASYGQLEFLERKIKMGCFGVVVDSAKMLETNYKTYLFKMSNEGKYEAREYLLTQLPNKKMKDLDFDLK